MSMGTKRGILQVGDFLQYCDFKRQVLDINNYGFQLDDLGWYTWGGIYDRYSYLIKKKKKRRIG